MAEICLTCVRWPAFTCVNLHGQFLCPWARKSLRTGFLGQVWPWKSSKAAGCDERQKTTRVFLLRSTWKGTLTSCFSYILLFCLWYPVHHSRKNLQKDSEQIRELKTVHRRTRILVAARKSSCWLSGKWGHEALAFGVTEASELWEHWGDGCCGNPS